MGVPFFGFHMVPGDRRCLLPYAGTFQRQKARSDPIFPESGLTVYGFGERKTPAPLVVACDKFIYTEVLTEGNEEEQQSRKRSAKELKADTRLVNALRNAVEGSSDEDGWAQLGPVGSNIAKQSPEFDARNFGYRKLRDLVEATGLFEVQERSAADGASKVIYVRDKRRP